MNTIVRLAKSEDYDDVNKLMNQIQSLHVVLRPDIYKPSQSVLPPELFDSLIAEELFYVAEADGKIVGVLELENNHIDNLRNVKKDILYIDCMCVDEKYRNRGIGHVFFDFVKQLKKDKGYDSIELQVNAKNLAARQVYENNGFTVKSINMELLD